MQINSQRFGTVDIDDDAVLNFPSGLIGFARERAFALIPHPGSSYLAWLQSVTTPELAFPVVSAHAFGDKYPDVAIGELARAAGLAGSEDDFAVLAVLCAPAGQPATVNLLAPVIVNATTHTGAQIILEGTRFHTREVFVLPPTQERTAAVADAQPLALAAG